MTELRFTVVRPDRPAPLLGTWREIHNAIIPTAPLSHPEVVERAGRNRLEVAYGLAFAHKLRFVETDRYLRPGGTVPFVDLRLAVL
jgi:hypothetical protein